MEIKLDQLNGHASDGTIGKLSLKVGDTIEVGQTLMQIETKKGNTPFKSKVSGKILEICVQEGDAVKKGDTLIKLEASSTRTSTPQASFDYLGGLLKGKKETLDSDLTIIGAGPGGYVAAIYAAKKGLKVTLIEKKKLGGTCLNEGCIPTKAFVKSAELYHTLLHSEDFGITLENPKADMKKIVARKNKIKQTLSDGIGYLLEKNGVKLLQGNGEFIDEHTVFVKCGKDEFTVNSKNIMIATGSKIANLNIPGIDLPCVLNSTTALDYDELPRSMTIIGGGVIGMEFAFIYAQLGVEVNVVEYMPRLLPMVSNSISEEITQRLKEHGVKIHTGAKVTHIEESNRKEGIVFIEQDGTEKYVVSEKVLVAIGREANLEGLSLDKSRVSLNENGRGIKVDDFLRTNVNHIYAIGDVNNWIQLAHAASHQAMIAVDNILGETKTFDPTNVPSVIFTNPEIATVGLTEEAAKEKGLTVKTSHFPFSANGKALTMGEDKGCIEIIKDTENNKLIGGSIIGVDASSLISSLILIIQNNLSEEQIIETIFPHPTTGEVIHECTLGLGTGALHFHE